MARRLMLSDELHKLVDNVYYQPPSSKKLKYPCIIYEQSNGRTEYGDNRPYTFQKKYSLLLIAHDPDTPLVRELAMAFPMIGMDRAYTADGLNHYSFTLYY